MSLMMRIMAPLMDKHTIIKVITATPAARGYVVIVNWITRPECLFAEASRNPSSRLIAIAGVEHYGHVQRPNLCVIV
jgi:hypothetical protein